MKSRLFWKICLAFWCAVVLVNQASWLLFSFYWDRPPPPQRMALERLAPVQLASARYAIETGGVAAFEQMQERWPASERRAVMLAPEGTVPRLRDERAEAVRAPDGKALTLIYRAERRPPPPPPGLGDSLRRSTNFIVAAALGGLLFAAALAWYLTRPIRTIQRGFERLAGGELSARLSPTVGRRRDEVADLARDFDAMAMRLEQLVAMRDQLLHDVSHELRSPLARLALAVALMRQNPDRAASSVERIEMEVRRLDELVGELLSLARLESGEADADRYFELGALVDAVAATARFEAKAKGVAILCQSAAGQGEIILRGDGELMRRALENIVRNAIRHSAQGQTVGIDIAREGEDILASVSDQGPGVPEDRLAAMFDPFVRIEQGDAAGQAEGFGLGLTIARRAIMALGGRIEARNRMPSGLEVRMILPFPG